MLSSLYFSLRIQMLQAKKFCRLFEIVKLVNFYLRLKNMNNRLSGVFPSSLKFAPIIWLSRKTLYLVLHSQFYKNPGDVLTVLGPSALIYMRAELWPAQQDNPASQGGRLRPRSGSAPGTPAYTIFGSLWRCFVLSQ